MSRGLTPALEAATLAEVVRPFYAVELDFASGMVRASTLDHDITLEGEVFTGVGQFGGIAPIRESTELSAYQMALVLSGVRPDLLAIAGTDHYQGRPCRIWFGCLDEDYQVIADPKVVFAGRIDTMKTDHGATGVVNLLVENRLADWDRPRVRRYTDADQQSEFPGDLFFEFVPQMQDITVKWGRQ